MAAERFYHIGYGRDDFGAMNPTMALISGDPERAAMIAQTYLTDVRVLSDHRGLHTSIGRLPNGTVVLSATSGMGAPSLSIVVNELVQVFREVRRVLRDDGVLWLNLGDSYAGNNSRASRGGRAGFGTPRELVANRTGEGLKPKDLVGIPWRVALALQADGWYLRRERSGRR